MSPQTAKCTPPAPAVFTVLLITILAFVILRCAWVSDDAYISFRVVDNVIHGHGLTWNVGERVQAFTNPLWVFVMSLLAVVTHEAYYTSIFASLLITVIAAGLIAFRVSLSSGSALLSIALLLCSKSFVDYSTSGLENPLSHLIIVIFAAVYFCGEKSPRRLLYLTLTASLGMLNRLDLALLFLPPLAWAYFRSRHSRRLIQVVVGFLPIVAWEVFSILYYGFALPNTYYAKLGSGIPGLELARQGISYFVDTLSLDPVTLLVIVTGLLVAWRDRKNGGIPFALGIALYLIYVVRIGGDFMSGRFFAAPFIVAVALISRNAIPARGLALTGSLAAALTLSLASPRPPLLSGASFGDVGDFSINARGIADERGCYYQHTGLLLSARGKAMPDHWWIKKGQELRTGGKFVTKDVTIGFRGYAAGPTVHIVDELALADPLLARLPISNPHLWRIGHLRRSVPPGYLESIESGTNRVQESSLAEYYGHLKTIISGPIWSWERFKTIAAMNVGRYDALLESYAYPHDSIIAYADVCSPKSRGTAWDASGNVIMTGEGTVVGLGDTASCNAVEISLDHNDTYELVFWLGSNRVGSVSVSASIIPENGLRIDTIHVDGGSGSIRYDKVQVLPTGGDNRYSLGHLRLLCGDDAAANSHHEETGKE